MNRTTLDNILRQFSAHSTTAQVVILDSNSATADALVAALMKHPTEYTSLYYGLTAADTDLRTFADNLTHTLVSQRPDMGIHLAQANHFWGGETKTLSRAIADGLSRDIAALPEEQRVLLILDHLDAHLPNQDLRTLIEDIALALPSRAMLVLNGGTSPTLQWNTLIAQTRTVILRDGALVQPSLSLETPNAQADLEVLALGTGLVSFNGQRIDRWDGHLPRLLLFFAVDRGSITRDDFQRAFWNGVNTAKATNVFHVTKRRLHRSLDFELLEHKAGSYRIHPDISVYYDAKAWMNALSTARAPLNPDPTRDYATVLALYRGAFLKGNTESWVISRRQDFLAGYLEAIIHTAAHYAQKFFDDPLTHHTAIEKAASLYDEALREAPYHPQVILAYAQLLADPRVGRRIEALYTLQAYLTTSPAPQDPLFERILALNQRLRGA